MLIVYPFCCSVLTSFSEIIYTLLLLANSYANNYLTTSGHFVFFVVRKLFCKLERKEINNVGLRLVCFREESKSIMEVCIMAQDLVMNGIIKTCFGPHITSLKRSVNLVLGFRSTYYSLPSLTFRCLVLHFFMPNELNKNRTLYLCLNPNNIKTNHNSIHQN